MDIDEFYQGSLHARVRIINDLGEVVTVPIEDTTRPGVESVHDVCLQDVVGSVEFEDKVTIVVDKDMIVDRLQLVYGDCVVSDRVIPHIRMTAGDLLTLAFRLIIRRDGNTVIIWRRVYQ